MSLLYIKPCVDFFHFDYKINFALLILKNDLSRATGS